MASKVDFQKGENKLRDLGIVVEDNIGELQIAERSDSDFSDDDDKAVEVKSTNNHAVEKLSDLIPGIITSKTPIVHNSNNISNSENVHIGDKTIIHGSVIIKQVIKRKGIDNQSYTETENENKPSTTFPAKTLYEVKPDTIFDGSPWHKLILSIITAIILGIVICALTFIILSHSQDDRSHSDDPESSVKEPSYTKVVGIFYENFQIIFTIIVMPITILLMLYSLLTWQVLDGDKKTRKGPSFQHCILDYPQGDFNSSIEKSKIKDDPLLIAPNHLRIVSRTDWLAQPVESELSKIKQPVPWVIITHTATEGCHSQSQCVLRVRLIQMFHIESKNWDDIAYNFLVAGDGSAYYGRGWDYIGAHTLGYNRYSIGIAFVGTFNSESPPDKQIEACQKLIKLGVQMGKIRKDYKLFAHRQLASTLSPGDKLYDIIKEWPHFVKEGTNIADLTPKDY
ncbi:unnamed protein product [Diatraea saccharalis]|uniref:Peptidoglycan recognition protein n=1 Tax=Diatraea saccharalis TaxID=40085 RepID=A0A9N9N144_9NEOP|nr:unnamed protein product [Diatraea saccharalis]